jgi:hypothetical protein
MKSTGFLIIDENEKRLAAFHYKKLKIRREYTIENLSEGLPEVFFKYLKHCRMLNFEERPNYEYLT